MAGSTAQLIAQRRKEREQAEAQERGLAGQPPVPPATERLTGALSDVGAQVKAFGRGAGNALSFGFYDPIAAGIEATTQPGGLQDWRNRFRSNVATEQAQDRYEATHYPAARTAGQVGGAVLSLAAGGPLSGGARLAGVAGMTGREATAWLAAHGAVGAGLQAATDLLQGRPLSWKNELGAASGGAAAAAAGVRLPPGRAGAIGGAVTSAVQDVLNGRPLSIQGIADGAAAGRLVGGAAGLAGRNWADGLSTAEKGRLGEQLGAARNLVNGRPTGQLASKTRDSIGPTGKKYWYPDRRVADTRYEDKFGYSADLRTNQRLARDWLGPNFVLNHFLPEDIGKLTGLPAASAGAQAGRRAPR